MRLRAEVVMKLDNLKQKLLSCVFILFVSLIYGKTSQAETITVTNLNDSGAGSLRQAIISANANADASAITFGTGLAGTINLSSALPYLGTSMTINGPGANVITVRRNGTASYSIFTVWG